MTHRSRARADCGCRWWREVQDGARINVQGVPYATAPSGPTSYGMKVLSLFISDQAFTLRRADDLLLQPDASACGATKASIPRRSTRVRELHDDDFNSGDDEEEANENEEEIDFESNKDEVLLSENYDQEDDD
ncbi:hypothetical protein GUJ93_ZPchr0001g32455 [Zizania palustris]|uniref:Uncharacterized protein n=1 Tax=Zizania palustris TaxID=103762 RepID=A0A8J5V764_ZIZPA|nr:hypothetical protein GUJ93_ZPchr0001g32455 [Zizania palustris]